jgi:UPF0042 nucleotide-binding protein
MLHALLDQLHETPNIDPVLLFLDAKQDVLIRRFSETRRPHPLALEGTPQDGIVTEFSLLEPFRARADMMLDTSDLSPHDLRAQLSLWFSSNAMSHLSILVQSFSYKRGIPSGTDLVFDCRFLKNPHWQPELRALNGMDAEVSQYIATDPNFATFFAKITDLALFLLPAFKAEGKSHLSIALGCTGGQHRSISVAEQLREALANEHWQVSIRHRELERHA